MKEIISKYIIINTECMKELDEKLCFIEAHDHEFTFDNLYYNKSLGNIGIKSYNIVCYMYDRKLYLSSNYFNKSEDMKKIFYKEFHSMFIAINSLENFIIFEFPEFENNEFSILKCYDILKELDYCRMYRFLKLKRYDMDEKYNIEFGVIASESK